MTFKCKNLQTQNVDESDDDRNCKSKSQNVKQPWLHARNKYNDMLHNLKIHRLLGHANPKRIKHLMKLGLCPKRFKLKGDGKIPFCQTCAACKGKRPSVKKKTDTRASEKGGRVFTDIKKLDHVSYGGHKYAIHFIDDATRFAKTYYLQKKNEAHLALKKYITEELNPQEITLHTLRYDGGTEYGFRGEVWYETSECKKYLKSKPQGLVITTERSPPYTPEMNGVAERYIQKIMNETRTILRDLNRDKRFWPLAMKFAERIINIMPTTALEGSTPSKEWYGENEPSTDLWQLPLCTAYAFDERTKDKRKALRDRREKLIYAGEAKHTPCYLLLREATGQIIQRRYKTVIFDTDADADKEATLATDPTVSDSTRDSGKPATWHEWTDRTSASLDGVVANQEIVHEHSIDHNTEADEETEGGPSHAELGDDQAKQAKMGKCKKRTSLEKERLRQERKRQRLQDLKTMVQTTAEETGKSRFGRRLRKPSRTVPQRARKIRVWNTGPAWEDQEPEYSLHFSETLHAYNVKTGVIPEPKGWKQATTGEQAKHWWKSIHEEWKGLWDMDTFEWVKEKDVPKGTKLLNLLWRFKVKPDRLKSRCCVDGSRESKCDYDDIYAPVCRHTTLRVLLQKAVQEGYDLASSDVKQAYLYATNPKEQYVRAPPQFARPGYVLRLKKMLYGLHASGKEWNMEMDTWLKEIGFTKSKVDECLYTLKKTTKSGKTKEIYLILYVDDCLYAGDKEMVRKFRKVIETRFQVRHADASTFLGLDIEYEKEKGKLALHQKNYIGKILKRFGMEKCKDVDTPMALNKPLPKLDGDCTNKSLQHEYRQIVGSLMFLAVSTRPDICYSVKELSRHLTHPVQTHIQAAKRVMRYLKKTVNFALVYTRAAEATLWGSADADWGGETNTAKSTTGYTFSLGSGSVSWKAGTQAIVTHSSTEAELVALDEAAREYAYLIQILCEFDYDVNMPVEIFQDNMSTIKTVINGRFNARTRHINVRYHYTHDLVKEGAICIKHIPTDLMPSDVLTKALGKLEHDRHTAVLLGTHATYKDLGRGF